MFKPAAYAREALGPHAVAVAPAVFGLPESYLVGRADDVKAVFSGEADGTIGPAQQGFGRMRDIFGQDNLIVAPEPRHSYLRKLIMPAFTSEAIESTMPRMAAVLARYLESWADGGVVKAHEQLRRMTFDFIITVVMGREYDESTLTYLSGLYSTWTKGFLAWPYVDLPFTPFGKSKVARRKMLDFFDVAVKEARVELAAGRAVPGILGSLVAALDEDGNGLTDLEITDNLALLMLAGHDTSSTTLTNTMACIQNNRYVLDKLREEQAAIIARRGAAIDGAALREMPYADAVIRETLRVHNVVAGLSRRAERDFEMGGFRIPAGANLVLPLTYISLADGRWVDDAPEAFRPERMLTPEGLKPGAQMPFGHGPRFCAGYSVAMAEMKVFLALLARGYDFTADTNTEWRQEIGRVPKNGLPMTLTRLPAAA
ncbi:MAG: cytochrome P450 [Monoraphidium minutum]|nr:MAG: cytochrome P450 [Monoraphidium minutum]